MNILSYAASELNSLFSSDQTINERTYRALISKAREELERLSKSDSSIRRITKASDKQTTEDAVMQLVLSI